MRAIIGAAHWSPTPLGPIERWPSAFRITLAATLASRLSMVLAWGRALVTLHNDAYRPLLGTKVALGRSFLDVWAEARCTIEPLLERALAGEACRFDDAPFTLLCRGEPEATFFNVSFSPVRDETGERTADLEQAHGQLRQRQKLEAMGSLTGGVAHDFNNLLTPIIGSLDMLARRRVGSERERRLINSAVQSADRAKTLVQRLLAFAHRQPLLASAVDLGALVEGMGLIGSTLGPRVEVQIALADDLPPAEADANQIEMALLNLAVNARDAMPDGGKLHGLAAQLGGALVIDSGPGQGTTVALWLPVRLAPIDAEDKAAGQPASRPHRGKALVVDDEELVRMTLADMLMDLGFEVTEAGSAEEALRLIECGERPDLLVTDHLMPGMHGAALARELRTRAAGLPVLIVSGYAEADGIAPDLPRLIKPFRAAELAERIADFNL